MARAEGGLFVNVFCHRRSTYVFGAEQGGEWMARRFFTGGLMPTLEHSLTNLPPERRSRLSGTHHRRAAEAWLDELDAAARTNARFPRQAT
jgi:cyclopropane-fatty-acyl-phospholipid synthase